MIIFNFLVYSSKIKDRKNALYTLFKTVSTIKTKQTYEKEKTCLRDGCTATYSHTLPWLPPRGDRGTGGGKEGRDTQ
jgi:hypothetical protein